MVHGTQDMVHGACTAISGADRYRGGKRPSSGQQHVSENLGKRGCCRLTLPAAATTVLGIGLDPSSFLPSSLLPITRPHTGRSFFSDSLVWVLYIRRGPACTVLWSRARMLNGQRRSSDDHPWLVTARDVPVRASQKPYGTREEGLMRAHSCRNLGKERMFGDWGGKEQGHDATRLSASRFVIRATWICMACVEAIRYGMKRWSIIYGCTGYDACVLFWKSTIAAALPLVSGPIRHRKRQQRAIIPPSLWHSLFPNPSRSALCHILRMDHLFALCYKGLPAKQEVSSPGWHDVGRQTA